MYEKRRDWEKLLGLERREARAPRPGPSAPRKFLEIAKLATERVKKPEVCIELWKRGHRQRSGERRGAQRARRSLRARQGLRQARRASSRSRSRSRSTTAQKSRSSTKLGTIYGDRLNNDEGAVDAWRALLAHRSERSQGARSAQEEVPRARSLGRPRGLLRRERQVGRVHPRPRAARGEGERRRRAKIGLLFKIAELWADKKQKTDRAAQGLREGPRARRRSTSRAAEALIPIYTQAGNSKALADAIEVKLGHEEDAVREARAPARGRRPLRGQGQGAAEGVRALPRGVRARARRRAVAPIDVERAAQGDRRVGRGHRRLPQGDRRGRRRRRRIARDHAPAAARSRARRGDEAGRRGARALPRRLRRRQRERRRARRARAALPRRRRATRTSSASTRRSASSRPIPARRSRSATRSRSSTRTSSRTSTSAIETYNGVLEDEPTDAHALAALDVLYRSSSRLGALRRHPAQADRARRRRGRAHRPEVPARRRRSRSTRRRRRRARELPRDPLPRRAARRRARGARGAARERGPARRGGRDPRGHLRGARRLGEALVALEILAAAEGDIDRRVQLLRKVARVAAEMLNDLARAFDAQARRSRTTRARRDARASSSSSPSSANAWDKLDAIFERDRRGPHRRAARAQLLDAPRAHRRAARQGRRGGQGLHPRPLASIRPTPRRSRRWTRSIAAPSGGPISSASTARRIELTPRPEQREAALRADGRGLRRAARRARGRDRGVQRGARARRRRARSRSPRSTGSSRARRCGASSPTTSRRSSRLADDDEAQIALMLRLAALRESRDEPGRAGDRGLPPGPRARPSNARRSRALERLGRDAAHELAIADLLEPLYRQIGDYQKLIGVHEVQVRRSDDAERAASSSSTRSRSSTRTRRRSQLRVRHPRARARGGSGERADAAADSTALARATGRFADLAQVFETLGREAARTRRSASTLYTMSARVYESDIGDVDSAIRHYRKVLEIDAANLAAAESLERLFRGRERYAGAVADPPAQGGHPRRAAATRRTRSSRPRAIEEDVLEQPEAAIAVYKKVLELDPRTTPRARRAHQALPRPLALGRPPRASTRRRPISSRDPEEKKRIYYQVGAVYERELGDVAQAIDTYHEDPRARSRRSPGALAPRRPLRAGAELAGAPRRPHARERDVRATRTRRSASSTGSPSSTRSTSTTSTRAIELYREILQRQVDHEPTLERPRRHEERREGSARRRRGPRAGLRGQRAIGRSSSASTRCRSRHADDPFQKVDLLHRIARLYEDALENHGSAFDTYARALTLDNGNEDDARRTSSASRWWSTAGRRSRSSTTPSSTSSRENPERFVELGLRLAQIFEVQLEDVDNAIGALPPRARGRRREPDRGSLARSPLHA